MLGLVLGPAAGGTIGDGAVALLGTGLCGALTTYSTFSLDAVRLVEEGRARVAAAYVVLSLGLGIAAALAGWGVALVVT